MSLKPTKPIYTVFSTTLQQDVDDYPNGRNVLTINWNIPNKFEEIEAILIASFSGLDTDFQLPYGNLDSTITLYADDVEIDPVHYTIDLNDGDGTVYSTAATAGQEITIKYTPLIPTKITSKIEGEIVIPSCVPERDNEFEFDFPHIYTSYTPKFYTNGIYITHTTPVIDTINKTMTTDKWFIRYDTGKNCILRAGAALPGVLSEITVDYFREVYLDHFEIIKIKDGSTSYTSYDEVINDPNKEIVSNNISASSSTYIETMTNLENGTNYIYYIFAVDSDENKSICDIQLIETIPSIVQNFVVSFRTGEVELFWDEINEDNLDGFNIYRNNGNTLQKASLVKLNNKLITGTSFLDSPLNTTNRKTPAEINYPIEGQDYTYVIEAVDSNSSWKVGTLNETSETSENLITQLIPIEEDE